MDINTKKKVLRTGLKNPKLPKYAQAAPVPPRKPVNIFGGMFDEELSKIPVEMHERVAILIQRNVEQRVKEYMGEFRQQVSEALTKQHEENTLLIA